MARKRRGRGEGSIYKRDDGLWVGSVSVGYNGNGRRIRRVAYGRTKTEVLDKLKELGKATPTIDPSKLTLGEFLTNWLENTVRLTVAPTTHGRYEQIVRLHLIPHVGRIPLVKFERLQIQQLFAAQDKAKVSSRNRAMSATVLHTALVYAASDSVKLLSHNPMAGLKDRPRHHYAEMHTWTAREAKRFLEAASKSRYHALYALALGTGMRLGEILALTWRDIDFDGGLVKINKTLEELSGKLRIKEPKTKAGKRNVKLPQFVIAALQDHRKRMLAEGHATAPIFCDRSGGHLRRSNFRRWAFLPIIDQANRITREIKVTTDEQHDAVPEDWLQGIIFAVGPGAVTIGTGETHYTAAVAEDARVTLNGQPCKPHGLEAGQWARIRTEAELPVIRFHDLRHTAATLLIADGESVKVVSERLGHAKVQITLDTYTHVTPSMQKSAAEKMDRLMA